MLYVYAVKCMLCLLFSYACPVFLAVEGVIYAALMINKSSLVSILIRACWFLLYQLSMHGRQAHLRLILGQESQFWLGGYRLMRYVYWEVILSRSTVMLTDFVTLCDVPYTLHHIGAWAKFCHRLG